MASKLAVLLGAGASHDLIGAATATVIDDYRPPLTAEIFGCGPDFTMRESFQAILETYQGARRLAATIGISVKGGQSLEAVLQGLQDSCDPNTKRHFWDIPRYLQHLFGAISDKYTTEPVNYTHLVHAVLTSELEQVAFVTTNYDLFLESALTSVTETKFDSLATYVPNSKWMLVKLHGSVNWARAIRQRTMRGDVVLDYEFSGEVEFLHHFSRIEDRQYPAVVVPVDGKYGFICPRGHVTAVKSVLASCDNFLIIGMSGKDQDLLDLLQECITTCTRLAVVGGEDASSVLQSFQKGVNKFIVGTPQTAPPVIFTDGFSRFLQSGMLDRFLKPIR